MVRAYSTDLRERAVAAVIAGKTVRVVADRFDVAVSSVVKWHQRYRSSGTVAPGKMGGHRKVILEPHRDFIIDEINRTPHLTVRGLRDNLGSHKSKNGARSKRQEQDCDSCLLILPISTQSSRHLLKSNTG